MDARPTTEQRELDDAAVRLVEKLGPSAVGDLDDHDRASRLDAALTQAGWRELRTGSHDEPLASGVEAALVARSLARGACDVAFIGPVLAHDLLRRADSDAAGDGVVRTVAVSTDLRRLAHGGGLAVDAAGSAAAIALHRDGGRLVELTLGESAAGGGVDLTRLVTAVEARDDAAVIGSIDADDLLAWEALAVTLTAADLVGTMEGALALSTDYARERRQYGVAIGSFQAVQHLLAEAKTVSEGALSSVLYAAWAVDALDPAGARAAAAVAKAYAARSARTVCETAIQVHGGIGNTWECMAHVYLRRALLSTELFGGDGVQLALLAQQRWGSSHGLS
ncbi:MAG: acyl-CoA dehydrogenase family protein [Ilumatobacteraceae bacterium]